MMVVRSVKALWQCTSINAVYLIHFNICGVISIVERMSHCANCECMYGIVAGALNCRPSRRYYLISSTLRYNINHQSNDDEYVICVNFQSQRSPFVNFHLVPSCTLFSLFPSPSANILFSSRFNKNLVQ